MSTTFAVLIDWDEGVSTNEIAYARRVKIRSGFDKPEDRVAAVGWCQITLDNSTKRFSPGYAAGPLHGKLLPRRLVRVRATTNGSSYWLFYGWIDKIEPAGGSWSTGEVVLHCVDGIALLQQKKIGVVYATEKSDSDAVAAVVAATYTPPATDYGEVFAEGMLTHYGRTWKPEETTAFDAILQICQATWARFFIGRNGVTILEQRTVLMSQEPSVVLTLDDEPVDTLDVVLDTDNIINDVQVIVYPVETIASTTVLWQSRSSIMVAPGESREVVASFHDEQGERCGAVNVVTPAATTDYLINEKADGTGFDYTGTSSMSMTTVKEATRAIITLTNNAIGNLYWTKLQIRGKPIITYDPVIVTRESTSSQAIYQKRARVLDLPMQADPVFGFSLASYLVDRFRTPILRAERMFIRGRDVLNGVNLFSLAVMNWIEIIDSQSGLDAVHLIRAVEYDLGPGVYSITYYCERADDRVYFTLDVVGRSELDSNARLGF